MRQVIAPDEVGPLFWASAQAPPLFAAQTEAFGIRTLADMDATTQGDLSGLGPTTVSVPCSDATGSTKCMWCPGGCSLYDEIPYDDLITNERAIYFYRPTTMTTTTTTTTSNTTTTSSLRRRGAEAVAEDDVAYDVILYRSQADSFTFYASTRPSSEHPDQESWSAPVPTNIPNIKTNLDAGVLADGRAYLASNPLVNGDGDEFRRDPVTLATSSDGGASFDRVGVALTCLDMPGHGAETTCECAFNHTENTGVSYPQVVAVVAPAPTELQGTYVAASNNKEDIWVTKVTPPS